MTRRPTRPPLSATPIPYTTPLRSPDAAVTSVGTLDEEHVDYAAELVASIPNRLVEAVHEPLGAVATIYCLLLDDDSAMRRSQLESLAEHARSEEHTSELQSLMRISYAVFCLNTKTTSTHKIE